MVFGGVACCAAEVVVGVVGVAGRSVVACIAEIGVLIVVVGAGAGVAAAGVVVVVGHGGGDRYGIGGVDVDGWRGNKQSEVKKRGIYLG